MSSSPISSFYSPGGVVTEKCDYAHETTEQNYCQAYSRLNSDKSPDGETLFVKTDCTNRQPLDPSQQDPVYAHPGVPLDRGAVANLIATWPSSVPEGDSCDVSYKFLFDEFEVRGKGWTDAELGPDGDNLKSQISGCGDLTSWNFQLTPTDPTYQWYASGNLPIGVKNCVGKAVQSAGGPGATVANCHGAG
jgi:hypothetical protein